MAGQREPPHRALGDGLGLSGNKAGLEGPLFSPGDDIVRRYRDLNLQSENGRFLVRLNLRILAWSSIGLRYQDTVDQSSVILS